MAKRNADSRIAVRSPKTIIRSISNFRKISSSAIGPMSTTISMTIRRSDCSIKSLNRLLTVLSDDADSSRFSHCPIPDPTYIRNRDIQRA